MSNHTVVTQSDASKIQFVSNNIGLFFLFQYSKFFKHLFFIFLEETGVLLPSDLYYRDAFST